MRLGKTLVRFFAFIRYLLSTKKVPKKDTKTIVFIQKRPFFVTFFVSKRYLKRTSHVSKKKPLG